jgi:endonuclease-3
MNKNRQRQKLERIDDLLAQAYGRPSYRDMDPLDSLIATILSQNTNDENSGKAYAALRAAYPTWRDVLAAEDAELERVLRPGGLARVKSRRIKKILRQISRQGSPDLHYLSRLPTDEAERQLLQFERVGYKTARCVMLFALGMEAFPIDTHIERVLKRVEIIPADVDTNGAHEMIPEYIPPGRAMSLHLNLIAHGRHICRPRNPQCGTCVIRRCCAHAVERAQ